MLSTSKCIVFPVSLTLTTTHFARAPSLLATALRHTGRWCICLPSLSCHSYVYLHDDYHAASNGFRAQNCSTPARPITKSGCRTFAKWGRMNGCSAALITPLTPTKLRIPFVAHRSVEFSLKLFMLFPRSHRGEQAGAVQWRQCGTRTRMRQ